MIYILVGNVIWTSFWFHNLFQAYIKQKRDLFKFPYYAGGSIIELSTIYLYDKFVEELNETIIIIPSTRNTIIYGKINEIPTKIFFYKDNKFILSNLRKLLTDKEYILRLADISDRYAIITKFISNIKKPEKLVIQYHLSILRGKKEKEKVRKAVKIFEKIKLDYKLYVFNNPSYYWIRKHTHKVKITKPFIFFLNYPERKEGEENNTIKLFFPSRLDKIKKLDLFLFMLYKLSRQFDKTILLYIPIPKPLWKKFYYLKIRKNNFKVIFVNWLNHWYNYPNFLKNLNGVLYYGDFREGYGLVPIEGLYLKAPIVAIGHSPSVYDIKSLLNYKHISIRREEFINTIKEFVESPKKVTNNLSRRIEKHYSIKGYIKEVYS